MQSGANGSKPVDPEVVERPVRRQFLAEYKLRILHEAERCTSAGEIGALLRREGLYSSYLTSWRKQRDAGALASMSSKQRGRVAKLTVQEREVDKLRRENERLRNKLAQAEKIIEVQKKLSEVLGVSLASTAESGRRK